MSVRKYLVCDSPDLLEGDEYDSEREALDNADEDQYVVEVTNVYDESIVVRAPVTKSEESEESDEGPSEKGGTRNIAFEAIRLLADIHRHGVSPEEVVGLAARHRSEVPATKTLLKACRNIWDARFRGGNVHNRNGLGAYCVVDDSTVALLPARFTAKLTVITPRGAILLGYRDGKVLLLDQDEDEHEGACFQVQDYAANKHIRFSPAGEWELHGRSLAHRDVDNIWLRTASAVCEVQGLVQESLGEGSINDVGRFVYDRLRIGFGAGLDDPPNYAGVFLHEKGGERNSGIWIVQVESVILGRLWSTHCFDLASAMETYAKMSELHTVAIRVELGVDSTSAPLLHTLSHVVNVRGADRRLIETALREEDPSNIYKVVVEPLLRAEGKHTLLNELDVLSKYVKLTCYVTL